MIKNKAWKCVACGNKKTEPCVFVAVYESLSGVVKNPCDTPNRCPIGSEQDDFYPSWVLCEETEVKKLIGGE
jgi:hypothetical protein